MKLAFLTELFPPYVLGGGEKQFFQLARQLVRRHEVHVYTMALKGSPREEIREGIIIHRRGGPPNPMDRRELLPIPSYLASTLFPIEADLYHANTYVPCLSGWLQAKRTGRPVVVTIHDLYRGRWAEAFGSRLLAPLGEALERLVCRLPYHRIITVSEATRTALLQAFRLPENRIVVIPNGIDGARIDAVSSHRDPWRVAFVGRLVPHKGVGLLLHALAIARHDLPDLHAQIVGSGFLKDSLMDLAKKLDLSDRVEFLGHQPEDETVYRVMKSSSLFAFPSTREGFGIAVLEAMRCGAVPILHDLPCYREFVSPLNSRIVPREASLLARTMTELLSDPARLGQMREAAMGATHSFEWSAIASRVEAVYQGVMEDFS
ncbi:MAG: glycosyltransferase family 4 protein [Deltaproteobacteria bacterium]|nr:glycosyltransferase family 4 protein [Deltaproteobacteria bacterium]MBI4374010.1 glycosyltransferase family 4 protein [Deltaproteobacteria bacterium]